MNNVILDIIKTTVPALIVFATVYYLFKTYIQQQYHLESLKIQKINAKNTLPLKLQAYERLVLLCERISIETLIYRLNTPGMEAIELRNALMIAIQQEYEHNLTQQIYVSENLWQIIKLAKEQMQNIIGSVSTGSSTSEFVANLYKTFSELKTNPVDFAKTALKKETELIFI